MGTRHTMPIIGRLRDGRPVYLVAGAAPDDQPDPVTLPEDLSQLTDDEIAGLETRAVAEFDAIYSADGGPDVSQVERATELTTIIQTLRGETSTREQARQESLATLEEQRRRIHGDDTEGGGDGQPDGDPGTGEQGDPEQPASDSGTEGQPETDPAGETAGTPEPALTASRTPRRTPAAPRRPSLNQHLRTAASRAPHPRVPANQDRPVLVAASEIPHYPAGTQLTTAQALVAAMQARARNMTISRVGANAPRVPIAYLERQHRFTLDRDATPQQLREVLVAATNPDVLVAAGGWCAPPTTIYDFYNIVAEDGAIDLPTVGVPRGSIQWPVSPSFSDVLGADDNPWTWTNQDDADALTQESVRKPCARIDCPTLDDATLECDGYCLTVGNLVDFAWSELVENHLQLLSAAHYHYVNTRKIAAMVAGSTAVTPTSLGAGVAAPVLSALDLQAEDLRTRFRMTKNAVIEAVLPQWIHGAIAADLALRQGRLDMDLGRDILADWLDARNIRAQFVADWQVGAAGQLGQAGFATDWPSSVQAMVYPPGTWLVGEGLRLDLGIIRDSVLNETNDHTAAFHEECWFVAKIGHQSRLATIDICPNGNTHSGEVIDCAS